MRISLYCLVVAIQIVVFPTRGNSQGMPPAHIRKTAFDTSAMTINSVGLDLLRRTDPKSNALLSPYSIQTSMAMTYAGARGITKQEMAKALAYPQKETSLHEGLNLLRQDLDEIAKRSQAKFTASKHQPPQPKFPIAFEAANRLYGQKGLPFLPQFLARLTESYQSPLFAVDFSHNANIVRTQINDWVAQQTHDRIRDLLPMGSLTEETRLVLVNALYMKAPWLSPFKTRSTGNQPFHVLGQATVNVPTMVQRSTYGYEAHTQFDVLTLPYTERDLQFLILLPKANVSLETIEKSLSAKTIATIANPKPTFMELHFPKLKIRTESIPLKPWLSQLGMPTAFSPGKADFRGIENSRSLFISEVFHKAFIEVAEEGTEAAAATAVVMQNVSNARQMTPDLIVRVDRPFLFAIQHRQSAACLFIGRVTDPRGGAAPTQQ